MNPIRPSPHATLFACLLAGFCSRASGQFAMGADVSWLQQSEALGVKYYDKDGKAGDCLAILKDLGINSIRLRTWVNPSNNAFSGHCSQRETIEMAMRCKKLGLRVMIDFHYGDSWTSVGSQSTPKAWQNLSYEDHKQALADYVSGFCKAMRDSGVTPEWFQNGNEINSGINPPQGSLSNPAQMTGLLNAGYDAMKAVFPSAKVLIHVAQPQNAGGDKMLSAYKANGGKLDAIGWSSYANSGNVDQLIQNVKTWKDKYKLETYMVEIGSSSPPADNKTLIEKWNLGMEAMHDACQSGTFYWEPEAYGAPGNWADAIFDKTGHPTVAFDGYKTPLKKACTLSALEAPAPTPFESAMAYLNPMAPGISIREKGRFRYSLADLQGRTLESGSAVDAVETGSRLQAGVYLIQVQGQGRPKAGKVSKYGGASR